MPENAGFGFDRVAEDYDRVRPDYPAALVDAACAAGGLGPGSRVVEVGCGTGKLTGALVERGLRVDAVDPGPRLIEVARRRVGESPARFHVGRFEDVELPEGTFDAVLSATAFHWVDPSVGWSKAARLLRPGGLLALLAYVGGSNRELEPAFLAAWREVVPAAASWHSRSPEEIWAGAEARRENVSELWAWLEKREIANPEAAGLFEDVAIETLAADHEETTDEMLALIRTTSAYLQLDEERAEVLEQRLASAVEEVGGSYRFRLFATLVTARARRNDASAETPRGRAIGPGCY
jgi:ubiquinone/menaquinone biosynthesis C-methylase UbiE